MCGIVGYVGDEQQCLPSLKNGLVALEYRGYDSAGLTFFENNKFKTLKSVGAPIELFKKVNLCLNSKVGIAHTRWATHGPVTEANAHPHLSEKGMFSVVHNGIIENYVELKEKYLKDVKFKSQTDSEVVANLLEKFYTGNELETILKVVKVLSGRYALVIMNKNNKNNLFFARKDMSLIAGVGENQIILSSDMSAFVNNAKKYCVIPNLSVGSVDEKGLSAFDFSNKKIDLKFLDVENNCISSDKNKFCYFMEKEIYEIPSALKATINSYKSQVNKLTSIKKEFFENIEYIKIIACGTSYHAGLVGQKLFEEAGFFAGTELASEFIYSNAKLPKNTLTIFVSQSGETADTLSAVEVARKKGAKTLGITNVMLSALDKACDFCLYLKAGVEKAVASTKAYNTQLLVFYILSTYLQNFKKVDLTLQAIENELSKLNIKKMHNQILNYVPKIKQAKNIFVVGRDFDYVTSLEASLKIKEITYKNCEAYAAGELKHGTLALVENKTVLIAFITQKQLIDKTLNIVSQAKARGASVLILSQFNTKKLKEVADGFINLPTTRENFMPLFSIIPIQLLAYETSLALGHNPDKPRNLAKSVTVE